MNKPLTDAELQHRMMAHTADVVKTIADMFSSPPRRMGEADDEYSASSEARAMDLFFPALAEFKSACQDAQALTLTPGVKDMFRTLLNALDDHSPSEDTWAEMMAGERNAR